MKRLLLQLSIAIFVLGASAYGDSSTSKIDDVIKQCENGTGCRMALSVSLESQGWLAVKKEYVCDSAGDCEESNQLELVNRPEIFKKEKIATPSELVWLDVPNEVEEGTPLFKLRWSDGKEEVITAPKGFKGTKVMNCFAVNCKVPLQSFGSREVQLFLIRTSAPKATPTPLPKPKKVKTSGPRAR